MTAVTDMDGVVSVEAPIGRAEALVGDICEVAWVGLDAETVVEFTLGAPARA